jgi:hypothetical protein
VRWNICHVSRLCLEIPSASLGKLFDEVNNQPTSPNTARNRWKKQSNIATPSISANRGTLELCKCVPIVSSRRDSFDFSQGILGSHHSLDTAQTVLQIQLDYLTTALDPAMDPETKGTSDGVLTFEALQRDL